MAHWAQVDENNIVINVTVGDNDSPDEGYEWLINNLGGTWIKTSYNTRLGVHYDPETNKASEDQSKAFRYHYASIGTLFDPSIGEDGAFFPPKPFDSWLPDRNTISWVPPIPIPDDGESYLWDEDSQSWQPVEA